MTAGVSIFGGAQSPPEIVSFQRSTVGAEGGLRIPLSLESRHEVSNPTPAPYEGAALPKMSYDGMSVMQAPPLGFEPRSVALTVRRAASCATEECVEGCPDPFWLDGSYLQIAGHPWELPRTGWLRGLEPPASCPTSRRSTD
jgi:hypothetical protein